MSVTEVSEGEKLREERSPVEYESAWVRKDVEERKERCEMGVQARPESIDKAFVMSKMEKEKVVEPVVLPAVVVPVGPRISAPEYEQVDSREMEGMWGDYWGAGTWDVDNWW
jgi:cytochrome c-type biogenesis protein CcmH/NrfG